MNAERPLGNIFTDLLGEVTALFRTEMRLARAEMSEKLSTMTLGIALAAAGAILLFASLLYFLGAATAALIVAGLSLWLAPLIVAAAALLVGGAVLWFGISRLTAKNLAPRRTVHQLKRDAAVARFQVQHQ
ncbi:MAG TPA: phage holin family protein [Rhizomicrobium sp.]|jgi:hypothetical protein